MMIARENNSSNNIQYTPFKNIIRLSKDIVPIHYNIGLWLYIFNDTFAFTGESEIHIMIKVPTQIVAIHCENLNINCNAIMILSESYEFFRPINVTFSISDSILSMHFMPAVIPGFYKLYLKFECIDVTNKHVGFSKHYYTDYEGHDKWLFMTHFMPMYARRMFPCFDEPAMKATFNISVRHSMRYTVLSNMPESKRFLSTDSCIWTQFKTTPRMSTYSVTVIVLPKDYIKISNHNNTINVWYKENVNILHLILKVTEIVKPILEKYTGILYPVPKIDYVLVPDISIQIENWGIIVVTMGEIGCNTTLDCSYYLEELLKIVVRKLAYQWLRNFVSPLWWNDSWLCDSIAIYLQYYITDKMFNAWKLMDAFVLNIQQDFTFYNTACIYLESNDSENNNENCTIFEWYEVIVNKGACLIRMLCHWIANDNVIQKSISKFITRYKYSSACVDKFWDIIQETMIEMNLQNTIELKKIMDSWIYQNGYPLINVKRDYVTGDVIITQEFCELYSDNIEFVREPGHSENFHGKCNKWWIPITLTTQSSMNFRYTRPYIWLKPYVCRLVISGIDLNDWVIVNLQQSGLYRVNYDISNWKKIATFLNSDNYTKIPALNRAQIIDDACLFVATKKLDLMTFLDLAKYLSRETDLIPWHPALKSIRFFASHLRFPFNSNIIKQYVLTLMDKIIQHVGFEEKNDDDHLTKIKRSELLEVASKFGHKKCKERATAIMTAHLNNPAENKIPEDLHSWISHSGMYEMDRKTWTAVLYKYFQNSEFHHLRCLSYCQNPDLITLLLSLTLIEDSPLPPDNILDLFSAVISTSTSNVDIVIDFITKNWAAIKETIDDWDEIIPEVIDEIKSWEQYNKV